MKKNLFYIIIASLLLISCEESFSPVGEFSQEFSINCILNSDSTNHVAVIKSTYPITDDSLVTDVSGAVITITGPRDEYTFEEMMGESGEYPSIIYSLSDWAPRWQVDYEFKAELESGEVFTSTMRLKDSLLFNHRFSDTFYPDDEKDQDVVTAVWKPMAQDVLAERRAFIEYYREIDGELVKFLQPVPVSGVEIDGQQEYVYSNISNASTFSFPSSNIDVAMNALWDGSEPKIKTYIGRLLYSVKIFDWQLASYMLTSSNVDGDFSASQHINAYSSFEGAYGVVGFTVHDNLPCGFDLEYVYSFGYSSVYRDWFSIPE